MSPQSSKGSFSQSASMQIRQQQTLSMSPQMKQAIELLMMNVQDLDLLVEKQLEANPLLELESPEMDASSADLSDIEDLALGEEAAPDRVEDYEGLDTDWDNLMDPDAMALRANTYDTRNTENNDFDIFELVGVAKTVQESLREQLDQLMLSNELRTCAESVIVSLDKNGFFEPSVEDFSAENNYAPELVREALAIVRGFDPPGIAGHDMRDSLLMQLKRKEEKYALGERILESKELFDLFLKNKRKELCAALDCSPEALDYTCETLSSLNPYPVSGMASQGAAPVIPDVIVRKDKDNWVVTLTRGRYRNLCINGLYKRLLQAHKFKGKDMRFVKENLANASHLIENIGRRNDTLYKVAVLIVEKQKAFFENGERYLKPLRMAEIANEIDCHEATVARTVSGKYMDTPQGVFSMKYFFMRGVGGGSEGEGAASSKTIMSEIRDLIAAEDKAKPLKDAEIEELLREKGYTVARRTIAKYRDKMEIPSAPMRRNTTT